MINATQIPRFRSEKLLDWYGQEKRDLPWRETKDPYAIWVSEIILQQTRVDQGLPYYERILSAFPTVQDLAIASEDSVLKLWEGLGYYSRARNLHSTAKFVSDKLSGQFPDTYDDLLSLKGIGPYTAAAVGSMAFGLPQAAVDGNVYRVIARFAGIHSSIDQASTKKDITEIANTIIDRSAPGQHNQAMMELGATICTPSDPLCATCPLHQECIAFRDDVQRDLPVRTKKTKVRDRYFYYKMMVVNDEVFIRKRPSGDIWQGLYEFPLFEAAKRLSENDILALTKVLQDENVVSISKEYKHILSHQRIFARFLFVKSDGFADSNFVRAKVEKVDNFAFPKLINRYLDDQKLKVQ